MTQDQHRRFRNSCGLPQTSSCQYGRLKAGEHHQDDIDIQKLIVRQGDGAGAVAVFTDLDTVQKVVEELIQADLGISINISGCSTRFSNAAESQGSSGTASKTPQHLGAKDRLPDRQTLEFNTMCGHGMVSFNLIRKMIEYVKLRRLTRKGFENHGQVLRMWSLQSCPCRNPSRKGNETRVDSCRSQIGQEVLSFRLRLVQEPSNHSWESRHLC